MKPTTGLALTVLLLFSHQAQAREVRDTVYTTDGDRVILSYELANTGRQTSVRFVGQYKKLGRMNASKYKDLSRVAVMFFDRTGNYGDGLSITNMMPEAFMIPSGVECQKSKEGFYLVQSEPQLNFTVKRVTNILIPIYLAYKPKKGKYILFAKSNGLVIPLGTKQAAKGSVKATQIVSQTITSTAEIESDNTQTIKILESIKQAKGLIGQAVQLPISDNLIDEIGYLRQKRREITDEALLGEISEVLALYEEKKASLEAESTAEQIAKQQAEEERMQAEANALKAQNDSISAAQQQATAKEKKRNLWMIVAGIVMAVLAFVGNQIFQNIRSKKSQMRMISMQQNIADRAEAEAKRRIRNTVRIQQNMAINQAKRKSSDAINKSSKLKVNGKTKNASI